MNYSAKPKYIFISSDVFLSKWGLQKYIMFWVNPGPTVYIHVSGFNFGRAAVLLALFAVVITAVNTGMYEV
jgi:hypothetical protein